MSNTNTNTNTNTTSSSSSNAAATVTSSTCTLNNSLSFDKVLRVLKDAKMILFVKHFPYLQFPDAFVLVLVERPRAAAEDWAWNTTIVTNDVIFCNFVAKSPFIY